MEAILTIPGRHTQHRKPMQRNTPFSSSSVLQAVDLVLPADLGMRNARSLKQSLDALADRPAVAIDGAQTSRASTGCVQVLYAFARTRAQDGRATSLCHPSESLTQAFRDLGLEMPGPVQEVC